MRFLSRAATFLRIVCLISGAGLTISCALRRAPGPETPRPAVTTPASSGQPRFLSSTSLGTLAVRKWQLENGLTIITGPDPAARGISYVTAFRVGSRDEDAAQAETGLAHLFEHLMFMGTKGPAGPVDFDQRLEEMGGSSNASTSHDYTSYADEVSPEALLSAIRLEADRMVNLDLDLAALDRERNIVLEERLAAVEDSVDGLLQELMYGQAFRSHPYRWPIIGRAADIKGITREKALAFYRRHYGPDRAVIVVVGRFEEAPVLAMLADAYGALPALGASPTRSIPPERAPAAEVRTRVTRPIAGDRLVIGFPAPALGDPDRLAYEMVFELLAGGPSARLYRRLVVDREVASSVNAEVAETQDPGLGALWIQMMRDKDASTGEELTLREVDRMRTEPVPAAELEAARNRLETEMWNELASRPGRAEALARFELTTGDFRTLAARSGTLAHVTAGDVGRVARTYLGGARSVVIAQPKGRP